MPTRRNAIRTLAASLGIGSLAGCSQVVSGRFEATPATAMAIWNGENWGDVGRERESGSGTVYIVPTAGKRIDVKKPIDQIGRNIQVVNYAVTHTIMVNADGALKAGNDQADLIAVGEYLTVTTPKIPIPGLENPATDFTVEDLVSTVGNIGMVKPYDKASPISVDEFDKIPSAKRLLESGYRGSVKSMEITSPPERVEGTGLQAEGTATFGLPIWWSSQGAHKVSFFGDKLVEYGDIVFVLGLVGDAVDNPSFDVDNPPVGEFYGAITHQENCDGDCLNRLEVKVNKGWNLANKLNRLFSGLLHEPLGGAELRRGENGLIVSNLGSTGRDGVQIDMPNERFAEWRMAFELLDGTAEPSTELPEGAAFEVTSRGLINDDPTRIVSRARSAITGDRVRSSVDLTRVEPDGLIAEYFLDDDRVLREIDLPADPSYTAKKPPKDVEISVEYTPDGTEIDSSWTYDDSGAKINSVHGEIIKADRVYFETIGAAVPLERYTEVAVTTVDIPRFTITDENIKEDKS